MNTNLKKKALLPLVAMVLVSVIAFSGVTYAWFTTSDTATVENLNVKVKAADGIQISLNAVNWSSQIFSDEIVDSSKTYGGSTNQLPAGNVDPVSTNGGVTGANLNMFLGKLQADNKLQITKLSDPTNGNSTEGNYVAFDLFFNMSKDTTVTLDAESVVTDSGKGSANSARVAFIDLGLQSGAGGNAEKVIIWEPTGGTATQYNGLKAENASGVATVNGVVAEGDYAGDVAETVDSYVTNATDVSLELNTGINKVRIYIWMEGQDADCVNSASGGNFTTLLKFKQPTTNA